VIHDPELLIMNSVPVCFWNQSPETVFQFLRYCSRVHRSRFALGQTVHTSFFDTGKCGFGFGRHSGIRTNDEVSNNPCKRHLPFIPIPLGLPNTVPFSGPGTLFKSAKQGEEIGPPTASFLVCLSGFRHFPCVSFAWSSRFSVPFLERSSRPSL